MKTIKEVKQACKELNLYVTENSNALHAAMNLREANTRLLEIEAIADIADDNTRKVKLNEYMEKYHG